MVKDMLSIQGGPGFEIYTHSLIIIVIKYYFELHAIINCKEKVVTILDY